MRDEQSAPLSAMEKRISVAILVALAIVVGCKSKGPVPGGQSPTTEAPKVATSETTGAHPGAANPHTGTDPHAGLGSMAPSTTAPEVGEDGMLGIGAIKFEVPATWKVEPPTSSMRRAQLKAPGPGGEAELVVYYFGPQGAGTNDDNIERWVSQFKGPGGVPVEDAKVSTEKVAGEDVTLVDVSGQYTNTMVQQGPATKADQRLMAAIVPSTDGPYYFKFLGPTKTVGAQATAFDQLIRSIALAR